MMVKVEGNAAQHSVVDGGYWETTGNVSVSTLRAAQDLVVAVTASGPASIVETTLDPSRGPLEFTIRQNADETLAYVSARQGRSSLKGQLRGWLIPHVLAQWSLSVANQ